MWEMQTTWQYMTTTPVRQMGKDAWDKIASPETVELAITVTAMVVTYEAYRAVRARVGEFTVNTSDAGGAGKFLAPDGKYYSTAFRTQLPSGTYPGGTYAQHFRAANRALVEAMDASPEFAQMMDDLIPGIRNQLVGPRGGISPLSPEGWVWHHNVETGIMDLVLKGQHTPGSIFWDTLHPNGVGGMATWNQ